MKVKVRVLTLAENAKKYLTINKVYNADLNNDKSHIRFICDVGYAFWCKAHNSKNGTWEIIEDNTSFNQSNKNNIWDALVDAAQR